MNENQSRKWVDVLQDIVDTYNNTEHIATGKSPNEMTNVNARDGIANLFHGMGCHKDDLSKTVVKRKIKYKLRPGDYVRTIRTKSAFETSRK